MKTSTKILITIGVILLILVLSVVAIISITVYQVSALTETMETETTLMQEDMNALIAEKNCSKIQDIENRAKTIKQEVGSVCKNPVIKIGLEKQNMVEFNCSTAKDIDIMFTQALEPIKEICNNGGLDNITINTA